MRFLQLLGTLSFFPLLMYVLLFEFLFKNQLYGRIINKIKLYVFKVYNVVGF